MKICYVAPDVAIPHYRGASTHVYELAKHFVYLGNEVHVIARRASSQDPKNATINDIKIHRVHRGILFSSSRSSFADPSSSGSYQGTTPTLIWKLYELYLMTVFAIYVGLVSAVLIRRERLDIILERESSFGAGAIASMITGRPLVVEVIGNRITDFQISKSMKIIAYSKEMFKGKVKNDSKIEIVTAGVDTELFRPDDLKRESTRKRLALPQNIQVVGYVGTFQEWHGISELLAACEGIILKAQHEVQFLMVGPYFKKTKEKVIAMGLSDTFIFTGSVPYESVQQYVCASDVMVAPYNPSGIDAPEQVRKHGLGSPLKLFEYLACAKPVVSTSVEPILHIIEDHVDGILIPPGDFVALENAVSELLNNQALIDRLGRNGRELAINKYSWLGVAERFCLILQNALRIYNQG